jgi:TonB family protein
MSWLLSYLFSALWQIPLLFAAAWIAARILRRFGSHVEHRLWVGALLLEIVLPACNIRMSTLWRGTLSLLPSHGAPDHGSVSVIFGPAVATACTLHLPLALEFAIMLAWAGVVVWFALRLVWGFVQTRTLARTATPILLSADAAERCARFGIAPPPQIAVSSRTTAPITIGTRRGIILLPPQLLENISSDDLDAVLAHETAHIARRDFAKNLLYSLLALPVTWHPLMWRTRARLAESRELICDEAAAAAVAGPRQYAHSLLRLASAVAGQPRFAAIQAVGILDFTSTRALERRVMILTRKPIPISTTRRILLATACSVLALATCTSALALRTDVSAGGVATDKAPAKKITVSPAEISGNKISGVNPTYPPEARKKKIQGTVVLEAVISKDGEIESLQVIESPSNLLSDSAMKAVQTWRYRPYLRNGEPVAVETKINVTYHLEG